MPAARTPKKDRAPSPRKTAKVPSSPSKAQLRKEWAETLKPWTPDRTQKFVHAKSVWTITATNAKKDHKLKDEELNTLPHEERPNDHNPFKPMRLYAEKDVRNLAQRKRQHLGLPASKDDSSSGSVTLIKLSPRQIEQMMTPEMKSLEKHLHPEPKPLIKHDYTSEDASEPAPSEIVWGRCKRIPQNVQAPDACLLFSITPEDIADLTEVSPWVDVRTVAMRAVTLHGGLAAHNALIHTVRAAEIRELEELGLIKSCNHFSEDLQLVLQPDSDEWMYEVPGRVPHSCGDRCVAQYFPPVAVCWDDNGCEVEWR